MTATPITRHESLQRLLTFAYTKDQIAGPAALAAALVESEQTVTNWGRRGVSKSGAMKAQAKFGCSANWVLTGLLPQVISGHRSESNVSATDIGLSRIPIIDSVQAGIWTEVVDKFAPGDADGWVYTSEPHSQHTFALKIRGDSMLPEFKPGDVVVIDPEISPRPGECVVAKNGHEEATFKKYRPRGIDARGQAVFELVPLNEDFESIRSDTQPIRIIGTMVEHRKYRSR